MDTRETRAVRWTPAALGIFFAFATLMCALAGVSLLTPGGALDWIWLKKPEEHELMLALGPWIGAGFLGLAAATAAASFGTFRRRRWGLWLAMLIFAVNAAGDAARIPSGAVLEGVIGVAITAIVLWWLTRPAVRGRFGRGASLKEAEMNGAGDWREDTLARLRALIGEADPEAVETVKWRKPSTPDGVPVWEHGGIICTGETYKDKVKLTFARGAALPDPSGLFNSSLDGNARRAIDIREGEAIDEAAFQALIRAAAAENAGRKG